MDHEQDWLGVLVALDLHGDHFELATSFVVANPTPSGDASRSGRTGRAGVGHDETDGASADPVSSCRPSERYLHLYHAVRPNRLCPTQPVAGARLAGVTSASVRHRARARHHPILDRLRPSGCHT